MTTSSHHPASPSPLMPPVAHKEPHAVPLHGLVRTDDYFWMRRKGAPDVEAYLGAENAYADEAMRPTTAFQGALYAEMLARIKETDDSVPYRDGDWLYYHRTEKGRQYRIHCRKKGEGGAEQVILDLNEIGKTEKFVSLGDFDVSDDGNLLAYTLDNTGFRQYTLAVKDLRTGALFPERMPRTTSVTFTADGTTLFYTVEDEETKRSYRLYRHTLGADPATDTLVYEEKDEMFDITVERSLSKGYLFLTAYSKTTSEVRCLRADHPTDAWRVIEPRRHDHEYYVDHRGDAFVVRTNLGADGRKAINFRVVTAPVATPDLAHWKEIVPHRPDVMVEGLYLLARWTVLAEREGGLPHVRFIDAISGESHRVAVPEDVYTLGPGTNAEFDTDVFRLSYESPITPSSVYDYDIKKRDLVLRKRTEVLGGYDPAAYQTRRIQVTVRDGTKVPVSLVFKKGVDLAGKNPTLLYGYGAYGLTIPMGFSSNRVSLLDRGVVFALAHIRGGGDLGKAWHEAGRMEHKMNTFTDFIDVADHLVASGTTDRSRLVLQGGSAGGLLMGVVINLRPDLARAVLAQVPFVDVINTMLDESLPLTVSEFEEWGNPKIKAEFDTIAAYSPYDNVGPKPYPDMLVRTSYNDSQVMYWEPAKWVAKLRAQKSGAGELLFKINMEPAGHGGKSGRYEQLRESAFDFAYILREMGITK